MRRTVWRLRFSLELRVGLSHKAGSAPVAQQDRATVS